MANPEPLGCAPAAGVLSERNLHKKGENGGAGGGRANKCSREPGVKDVRVLSARPQRGRERHPENAGIRTGLNEKKANP